MHYTDVLRMIGGLSLFLFGMQVMGQALEKRAGSRLSLLIQRLTTSRIKGLLTGLVVTAIIQSSSATTVMVVGFVNSGVMSLGQAINVIMGANIGTTTTAWLLSLVGISGTNPLIVMLKPTSFTPILAVIGVAMSFSQSEKKKDIGTMLLGFATLMFGMDTMSSAVSGLSDVPEFRQVLVAFSNPLLGLAAGAIVTGIIQASAASVGMLQALSLTGQVSLGIAIPIILGQNIGTCVTALLSSIGTNTNARRTAFVHFAFNVIGALVFLAAFVAGNAMMHFAFLDAPANAVSIAVVHSIFNVVSTAVLFPFVHLLERLAIMIIPEGSKAEEEGPLLDQRLLVNPPFAVARCREVSNEMAGVAADALTASLDALCEYTPERAERVRKGEDTTDRYEDVLGSYLVQLSKSPMSEGDSAEVNRMLHGIGDFERIADHAVNLVESAEELQNKGFAMSEQATRELAVLYDAVREIIGLAVEAYTTHSAQIASKVAPLEETVDALKRQIRSRHILRLQAGECPLPAGFVLSDLLTNLERVSDHCQNIADCVLDAHHRNQGIAASAIARLSAEDFEQQLSALQVRYSLP